MAMNMKCRVYILISILIELKDITNQIYRLNFAFDCPNHYFYDLYQCKS